MIVFDRFPVTARKPIKMDVAGQALPVEQEIIYFQNKLMCIERVMYNRVFAILGEQKNAKATYVLYIEIQDPIPEQETDVTWTMHNMQFSGKVKFIQPYSKVVLNRIAECYIQSDNQ
jgi:hypothetical protein